MAKRSKKRCEELPILHPHAAGIDVGASELFVAVSADRDPQPVRSFPYEINRCLMSHSQYLHNTFLGSPVHHQTRTKALEGKNIFPRIRRLMRPSHSSPSTSLFALTQTSLLALFFLTIAWVGASAQIDRAVLEGTVADPTGRVIAGASLKLLAADTGITQKRQANASGYYRFPGLAVGHYTMTASSSGFRTSVMENVGLQVGQTHTLDIQVPVGGATENVEVRASNAPAERSSAESSTVIREDQIANLPNNGRDWASFTLLAPFAQDDGGGDQRTIRFAGRARDDNNFQFDGVDAGGIQEQAQKSQTRLQISQDAIEEYRVSSALYDAEYGTQSGGQIDVVTKSGTNDLHGSLFGYLRNSVFDARNFNDFDINGNPAIPTFRYGQYGMSLGGPVVKDKVFFFLNYEGLRQYGGATTQALVPAPSIQQATLANPATAALMCPILQAFPWRKSTGSIGSCQPKFVYPDAAFVDQTSQGKPDSDQIGRA